MNALTFAALGAALIGVVPRAAVAALAVFAVGGHFVRELAPIFSWLSWVRHLSVFWLYGNALGSGVSWGGVATMLAIVAGSFGVAVMTMHRRDVGR